MNKHQFFLGDLEKRIIHEALLSYRDFLNDLHAEEKEDFARDMLIDIFVDLAKKFEIKE